jgi:formylglycine-generating enzyme required for sulfatase activity
MDFIWIDSMKIWVGKYEVTNGDFRKFKSTHDSKKSMGFSLNKDRQPVLEISYYDAVGYCTWLNAVSGKDVNLPEGYAYRLPSREEWESVARCGGERLYPWGNDWPPKYGNFGNQEVFPSTWKLEGYADEFPVTCEVEKSGENEWGIAGMAGNVWEWTSDLKDDKRAVLGGDWTSTTKATLIVAVTSAYAPMNDPFDNIGFRIFLAPKVQD